MTTELISADPAHPDEIVGRVPAATVADVDPVVQAARAAGRVWSATPAPARARGLRAAAAALEAGLATLSELTTREQGKTLAESRGEVQRAIDTLHHQAARALAPEGETFPASTVGDEVRTIREPVGVVAAITPWNFPVAIPIWKIAPALAHGNAVVWKPAEQTPAVAQLLSELLGKAGLPEGLIGMVLGGADVGAAVVDHPDVGAISFTGSVGVGRIIRAHGSARGVGVQAEMGGHNPALVFDDAPLERAADHVVAGAMLGSGQKCTATRRVLVAGSVYDRFVELLVARTERLVVGDGLDPASDLGPVIDAAAKHRVLGAVADARAAGCELLTGGPDPVRPLPADGHFVAPTLLHLGDRSQAPPVWREEVFGPLAVVTSVADDDEAIAVANDTSFGLSAAVHTRDLGRARRAATMLQAGMIAVNGPTTGAELHAPFGGHKDSTAPGPREQGEAARDFFTRTKTVTLRDPGV